MSNVVIAGYARSPFTIANKGALARVRPDDIAAQAHRHGVHRSEALALGLPGEQRPPLALPLEVGAVHVLPRPYRLQSRARTRLGTDSNVSFEVADYATAALPHNQDSIVSALSIHHLDNEAKKSLFKKIYAAWFE